MSRIGRVLRLTHESVQLVRKSRGANDMKYILMMNCPKYGYDSFGSWPKKDIQAHIAFMIAFDKPLKASGELLSAEGLANPHEAKLVRGGIGGQQLSGCLEWL